MNVQYSIKYIYGIIIIIIIISLKKQTAVNKEERITLIRYEKTMRIVPVISRFCFLF